MLHVMKSDVEIKDIRDSVLQDAVCGITNCFSKATDEVAAE